MSVTKISRASGARDSPARPHSVRELAAATTRDNILRAAIKVFARHGYAGGSVEKISRAAKSYDRMIYYYFGSKEGLFIAALEEIYARFIEAESALELDLANPREALGSLVTFFIAYYAKHPEFITLLNTENLHRGKHISKSRRARNFSSPAISVIDKLLRSGADAGVFRADIRGRDLYLMIAGLAYFYRSNRFTLSAFLGEDLEAAESLAQWASFVTQAVLRTVAPPVRPQPPARPSSRQY